MTPLRETFWSCQWPYRIGPISYNLAKVKDFSSLEITCGHPFFRGCLLEAFSRACHKDKANLVPGTTSTQAKDRALQYNHLHSAATNLFNIHPDIELRSPTLTDVPSCAFRFSLKSIAFFALPAELPDHALGPEHAVSAGIGARLAIFQTFLAIADPHLLTGDIGFTIRMISTCHD